LGKRRLEKGEFDILAKFAEIGYCGAKNKKPIIELANGFIVKNAYAVKLANKFYVLKNKNK